MSLSYDERKAIVQLRLERALQTMEEAKGNMTLKYWHVVANRLYYAAYYAVSALLIANGDTAQTHAGVKVVFGLHFVKTNIVSREVNDLYSKLFALRMTGDYDDTYNLREEEVMPLIEPTEALINTISALAREKIKG